jgi:beta-galactosidase/beta-glucuronidase
MEASRRANVVPLVSVLFALAFGLLLSLSINAQSPATRIVSGPFHGTFLDGGEGISEQLKDDDPTLDGTSVWTMHAWVRSETAQKGTVPLFGLGDVPAQQGRWLALIDGQPAFMSGSSIVMRAKAAINATEWSFVAISYERGTARMFVNGRQTAEAPVTLQPVRPVVHVAPVGLEASHVHHFGGSVASFQLLEGPLSEREVGALYARRPNFSLINFQQVSVGWPWQTKQLTGLAAPQPPATLPSSKAPLSRGVAVPNRPTQPVLARRGANTWTLARWRMIEAPKVATDAASIATVGFDDQSWYAATVPGTVLTTLIDNGVYPDPDYGLNNMAIPESLNKQDYWYRSEFAAPDVLTGRHLTLTFNGINYVADVWLNGQRLGSIKGAFIRGVFDVTGQLRPGGRNSLAVRISPPPHPGIPHEQSIKAGPGENGGALALDGPTFVASEGWDWIPGIRDRNSGLWRDVILTATSQVSIGDPQVISTLPLPATDRADLEIDVPLQNSASAPIEGVLTATFDRVTITKQMKLAPGATTVRLQLEEFAELRLRNPRLWWPNGYGSQELYDLKLEFAAGGAQSDTKSLRFGVRHVTYELSLFDEQGQLRRVAVDLTAARSRGERLIDVRHEALKKSPEGWAASLYPGALQSPGVRVLSDTAMTPHLVLVVNGVRIASRGGNWGMDDSRKRVSRERLEPYFRLHREANLNTIRNWVGQNTEEEFFELADEYGMLVLNDFWASTQDFQVEPEDAALFLNNARDTISRYRNHPSIVLWFGRNEGVPQPILNSGLADLVAELDGTRHFTGSSNRVNLAGSGPYNYRPPVEYFNQHAEGYSVEVGTPSLATLESIRAWTPQPDQWPISDVLAYHDWHHGGNGDTASFMKTLDAQFGPARSLEDFERKAQMMNYVTHRAMFEGFHAQLWTKNSGRLLWMTHPAWPSHAWQIYSSDYDTHASFYGVKKACEPIHVQMNLPDFGLSVVNTTLSELADASLRVRVFDLRQRVLHDTRHDVRAAANTVTHIRSLDLAPYLASEDLVLVKLELKNAEGKGLAENFYWQGRDDAAYRQLNDLPVAKVRISASASKQSNEVRVRARLENTSSVPALATKLTLQDARGARILPAYYSDNYVSLLPGEVREIEIAYPKSAASSAQLTVRGWNVSAGKANVAVTVSP